jgi:hypothetical protein
METINKPIYVIPGLSTKSVERTLQQVMDYRRRNVPSEQVLVICEKLPTVVQKVTENGIEEMTFVEFIQELLKKPIETDA